MKKVEELGDALVEFMSKRKRGISFADINKFFAQQGIDYKGEQALTMTEYPSIIYWANWNELAVNAYLYMTDKLKIEMTSCSELVYIADGMLPKMAIAKSIRNYQSNRWLPVVMEVVA